MDKEELVKKIKATPFKGMSTDMVEHVLYAINEAGFAIVPREASDEMLKSGQEASGYFASDGCWEESFKVGDTYKAMIEAGEIK